jgi:hypothetical protein
MLRTSDFPLSRFLYINVFIEYGVGALFKGWIVGICFCKAGCVIMGQAVSSKLTSDIGT